MFKYNADVLVINLLNSNIQDVVDQIHKCERCISKSLHGLVTSDSYNIPCLRVRCSDRLLNTGYKKFDILGDGIKFMDYFSSLDIPEYQSMEVTHIDQFSAILSAIPQFSGSDENKNAMVTT